MALERTNERPTSDPRTTTTTLGCSSSAVGMEHPSNLRTKKKQPTTPSCKPLRCTSSRGVEEVWKHNIHLSFLFFFNFSGFFSFLFVARRQQQQHVTFDDGCWWCSSLATSFPLLQHLLGPQRNSTTTKESLIFNRFLCTFFSFFICFLFLKEK